MAEWESFDATGVIPDEIISVAEDAADLAAVLGPILDTAADVVDLAALFVQGYNDAQKAAIEAFQDLLLSTVQQLLTTGVYMLPHVPASWKLNTTPNSWLRAVTRSLDDVYDENRPILVDPYAYVGCVVVMTSVPNYPNLFGKLLRLFGLLIPSNDQVNAWPTPYDEFQVIPGVGQAPDWMSKRIADFVPQVGELVDVLLNFSDSVTAAAAASDIYGRFAEQLRQKAIILNQIAATVDEIVASLEESTDFTGAFVLPIIGQGDKAWLQNEILTATGGPHDLEYVNYSAGITFLTTGGTSAPAELLLSLFGLS